ncbi:MAG: chemotaxis response regulator protein-glutamate methylesterase [Gammaproteobacteria bacterium]|nr:chemotaxis response regulator protein-glutamate methylesterase [Gammaproteobacteria bacterium]MDH5728408.1 chemotaxis response regulator protein-glutamate methylesterase [Gammaproteobacteria bacterium]
MSRIKVLVVDDSALIRQMLTELLSSDPNIEVVGSASDPYAAREKIKKLKPDVLTLDVEMPKMDGITFLNNLMRLHPMPVIMVSTLTEKGADVTLQALELGAIDFVTKPKLDVAHELDKYGEEIVHKVKIAAGANVLANAGTVGEAKDGVKQKLSADAVIKKVSFKKNFKTTDKIIAIGASTGGTEAIKAVLQQLPADCPGVVITQHIPALFSKPFAERMDKNSAMKVYEAEDGQQILPGHVYIAPGDKHLVVERDGARYICRLNDGPPVNRHKPAVDVMFRSVAQNAGPNSIAVLLTGMGADGAAGMKEMLEAGADTIVQDERTSVVWGMPGEAVRIGVAQHILPLDKVATEVCKLAEKE